MPVGVRALNLVKQGFKMRDNRTKLNKIDASTKCSFSFQTSHILFFKGLVLPHK